MENKTVNIPLDDYNKLRDFKCNHLNKYKRVKVNTRDGYLVTVMTNNEIIKALQKELDDKIQLLATLDKEHYHTLISYSEFKATIKAMNSRQFRKWKNEH